MADKKITQLTNITGANLVDADEFVVVDISADETKAITLGELKEAFDSGSGFVRITGDTMTGPLDVQSTITSDGLTVDGNVGIGTSSIDSNAKLVVSNNGAEGLEIRANSTNIELLAYNRSAATYEPIVYNGLSHEWRNSNGNVATIDSSGNLLVGKTASSGSTQGAQLQAAGNVFATASNDYPLYLNRLGSDGQLAQFRKDGTQVGSIGAQTRSGSTELGIGTGDTGLNFFNQGDAICPVNMDNGFDRNGAIDLGRNGVAFKDLYLSGGVYLGGTGSANTLDDYEEGQWTPSFEREFSNPTWSSATAVGRYIKVGDLVYVSFYWYSSTMTSGGSGNPIITGLPFYLAYGLTGEYSGGTGVYNLLNSTSYGPNLGEYYSWRNEGNKFRLYSSGTSTTGTGTYEFSMNGVFTTI